MGYLQDYVSSICDGHSKSPENLKAAATGGKFKAKRADNGVDKWFKGFAGGGVDRFFKVSERNSNFTTDVRAGFTTFLTAAYISTPRISRTRISWPNHWPNRMLEPVYSTH